MRLTDFSIGRTFESSKPLILTLPLSTPSSLVLALPCHRWAWRLASQCRRASRAWTACSIASVNARFVCQTRMGASVWLPLVMSSPLMPCSYHLSSGRAYDGLLAIEKSWASITYTRFLFYPNCLYCTQTDIFEFFGYEELIIQYHSVFEYWLSV